MAPKKGSKNTKISPNQVDNNQGESNNLVTTQMEQLMKIIQGYEEQNSATVGMMNQMKRIFDEKLQALEKDNNIMKERTNKKGRTKNARSEETSVGRGKKAE